MKYSSARAFRQALEDRLRTQYPAQQIPRLRKMIAFERFMARLEPHWILKGGYALQLRTEKARTTQDVDLLAQHISTNKIRQSLLSEARQDRGDHFDFFIEQAEFQFDEENLSRFHVTSRLAGRVFERFHIDIGYGDPIIESVEYLSPPNYLDFAEIDSPSIPCYPVTQHIAEKLHAILRPRPVQSSRTKDFIDLLIFAEISVNLEAQLLKAATQAVFNARGDALPEKLEYIPPQWEQKFKKLAKQLDLPYLQFNEAIQAVQDFINPALESNEPLFWNPESWQWEK